MTNEFEQLLKECLELHNKKSHDYAQEGNKYSNFTRAAEILSWFKNPIDQVFACMIGIKLARLAELRNGKEAKNESTRDSGIDLVNYAALWQSYYDSEKAKQDESRKEVIGQFKEVINTSMKGFSKQVNEDAANRCSYCGSDVTGYHKFNCPQLDGVK